MAESKIVIGADVSAVESGVEKAKKSLHSLGEAGREAGSRGSQGLGKIGAGAAEAGRYADVAARKLKRSSVALENAIKRDIAMLQAGTRQSRQYYEALAEMRGLDKKRFDPLLRQLDLVNAKTQRATLTQKQYNNAVRQVPAQITDVVTQLAGGQNPLLIALQQGGQLRDSFGGIGTMFRGIAEVVTPARLALAGFAGALTAAGLAIYQGREESQAYERAVIMLGASADFTGGQLQVMARQAGEATGNYSAAREAVLALAQSGKVGTDNLQQFAQSITLQSIATGKSIDDLVEKYVQIANDPLKAAVELANVYKSLTADVYNQARALKEQGREQEAVALIQKKFSDESAEMSRRVIENLGFIERGWIAVKEAAGGAWDFMKSIGRIAPLEQQLADVNNWLADNRENNWWNAGARKSMQETKARLEEQIATQKKQLEQEQKTNQIRLDGLKATEYLHKETEKYLTKEQRLRKDLLELEKNRQKALTGASTDAERARLNREYDALKWRKQEEAADKPRKIRTKRDRNLFPTVSDGLRIKPGAEAGGKAHGGTYAFAHFLQSKLGNDLVRFGAFRDRYHIGKNSFHNSGLAFDATPSARLSRQQKAKVPKQIEAYLRELGFAPGKDFNVKFEVAGQKNKNGTVSTADHWHFNWRSKEAAARFAKGAGGQAKSFAVLDWFKEAAPVKDYLAEEAALLQKRLDLLGKNSEYERVLWETSKGRFVGETAARKTEILEKARLLDAERERQDVEKKYAKVLDDTRVSVEKGFSDKRFEISLVGKLAEEIERLKIAREFDAKIAEGAAAGAGDKWIASMEAQKQVALENAEAIRQMRIEQGKDWRGGVEDGLRNYTESAKTMREEFASLTEKGVGGFADSLADLVATGKGNFSDFALSVGRDISRMLIKLTLLKVAQEAVGLISGGGSGGGNVKLNGNWSSGYTGLLQANGGAWLNGVQFFAKGGAFTNKIVNKPTMFAHGGGFGVMGEAGPEAIMPLARGSNGKLGVIAHGLGSGMGNMTVNITINKEAGAESDDTADSETAKALASALPAFIERWVYENMLRPGSRFYVGVKHG